MPWRIARILERGLPHVPPPLLSPAAATRLAAVPDALPAVVEAAACECRLDGIDDRVDFMCGLYRPAGQQALLRARARGELDDRPPEAWQGCFDLLEQWSDPASVTGRSLEEIWLEFDVAPGDPEPPAFAFVSPLVEGRPARADQARAAARTLTRALDLLRAAPTEATLAHLTDCLSQLPPWGRLLQCAPLQHRRADVVRLVLAVEVPRLRSFLERVHWPGDLRNLQSVLHDTGAGVFRPNVQLDVGPDGPLGHLSLEFNTPARVQDDPRWARLMTFAVHRGGCDPHLVSCLANWPGGTALTPRHGQPVQVARLLQLKVSMDAAGATTVKAYLGYRPQVLLFW